MNEWGPASGEPLPVIPGAYVMTRDDGKELRGFEDVRVRKVSEPCALCAEKDEDFQKALKDHQRRIEHMVDDLGKLQGVCAEKDAQIRQLQRRHDWANMFEQGTVDLKKAVKSLNKRLKKLDRMIDD